MKQDNVSQEYVYDLLNAQIEEAWKDLNRESLTCKEVPMQLIMRVINMTRIIEFLHKDEDIFTVVGEEVIDYIKSHFIHAMSL